MPSDPAIEVRDKEISLLANAIPSVPREVDETTRICYNRGCDDYRKPRKGNVNCSCKKTRSR